MPVDPYKPFHIYGAPDPNLRQQSIHVCLPRIAHSTSFFSPMLNEHEKSIKGPDTLESGQSNKPTFPSTQGNNVCKYTGSQCLISNKKGLYLYHVFFKIVITAPFLRMTDKDRRQIKRSRKRGKGE